MADNDNAQIEVLFESAAATMDNAQIEVLFESTPKPDVSSGGPRINPGPDAAARGPFN